MDGPETHDRRGPSSLPLHGPSHRPTGPHWNFLMPSTSSISVAPQSWCFSAARRCADSIIHGLLPLCAPTAHATRVHMCSGDAPRPGTSSHSCCACSTPDGSFTSRVPSRSCNGIVDCRCAPCAAQVNSSPMVHEIFASFAIPSRPTPVAPCTAHGCPGERVSRTRTLASHCPPRMLCSV